MERKITNQIGAEGLVTVEAETPKANDTVKGQTSESVFTEGNTTNRRVMAQVSRTDHRANNHPVTKDMNPEISKAVTTTKVMNEMVGAGAVPATTTCEDHHGDTTSETPTGRQYTKTETNEAKDGIPDQGTIHRGAQAVHT